MAELITGSRDHQWRSPQPELGPSSSQPPNCPVCAEEGSGLSTLRGPGVPAPKTSGQVPPAPKPAPAVVAEVAGGMPGPAGQVLFDCPALDDYEVLGKLGHGGMGVVYWARERKLDRVV